jgi:TPP-dependent pyruvate/acetoin dehydrogenase alpha subunit
LRQIHKIDISSIAEVKFLSHLLKNDQSNVTSERIQRFHDSGMTIPQLEQVVQAGLITFLLHVESRIASSLGQGFYTIGPCGEESLAAIALNIKERDASALHYRHVSLSVLRQLKLGRRAAEVVLDRARGFTCSTLDPVTGGKHCAIGGTPYDFLVTSTLASQACPAVGRALAIPLTQLLRQATERAGGSTAIPLKFPKDSISVVSVGEGSTNNAHFLSALNLAEYSAFKNQKVY